MRYMQLVCWILLVCLTFFSHIANAAKPTYVVYTESWAPYSYLFEKQVIGISTDIVREVFSRAGLDFEIILVPWARGFKLAKTEENAFIFMTKRTVDRESEFQWIGPLEDIDLSLFKLSSRTDLHLASLTDLKHYLVGVERDGSSHQKLLDMGLKEQIHIYPVNKFSQLLGMLYRQRIDFVITNNTGLRFQMQMTGLKDHEISHALDFSSGGSFYLAANKSIDIDIINKLQEQLYILRESGASYDIKQRYLKP